MVARDGAAQPRLGQRVLVYTPIETLGQWPWIAAGTAFVATWAAMFVAAVTEYRRLRRSAEDSY